MRRDALIAARIAAGHSREGLARAIGASYRSIVRWEIEGVTPQPAQRAAWRDALGLSDAEMTRMLSTPDSGGDDDMDRRQLLGGIGLGIGATLLGTGTAASTSDRVGRAEITRVRDTAMMITTWSREHGSGGLPNEVTNAQLRWAAGLLHANVTPHLRSDLFSAVGYLAGVIGFARFDDHDHEPARTLFGFARQCAEEADDWHLRARALNMSARQAIWTGDPDTGLTHVELALVRADRLTSTEVSSLHTLRARALAKLGRVEDALAASGAADEAFTRRDPHTDPVWMAYYDEAQHRGDTGHALADLSRIGAGTDAVERLAYSVVHHPAGTERSRIMSQIELADLHLSTGDHEAALEATEVALVGAGELRSARARDTLQRVHRRAIAAPPGKAVVALRERLDEHFETAA